MKRMLQSALCLGLLTLTATAPAADQPFKDQIDARQGLMQVYKFNLGILAAMAKGTVPYDAEAAKTAAGNLHLATQMKNGAMWPKGSGLDNPALAGKTSAKGEIWTSGKIGDAGKALAMVSAKMADTAGNGLDALRAGVGEAGKACKGCHDDFRAKK